MTHAEHILILSYFSRRCALQKKTRFVREVWLSRWILELFWELYLPHF